MDDHPLPHSTESGLHHQESVNQSTSAKHDVKRDVVAAEAPKAAKTTTVHQVEMFEAGRETEKKRKDALRSGRPPLPPIANKHSDADEPRPAFVDMPMCMPLHTLKGPPHPHPHAPSASQHKPPSPSVASHQITQAPVQVRDTSYRLPPQPPLKPQQQQQQQHKDRKSMPLVSDCSEVDPFTKRATTMIDQDAALDVSWGQAMSGRKMSAHDRNSRGYSTLYQNYRVKLMPNFDADIDASTRSLPIELSEKARSAPSLVPDAAPPHSHRAAPETTLRTRAGSLSSMIRSLEARQEQNRSLPPPMAVLNQAMLSSDITGATRSNTSLLTKSGAFSLDHVVPPHKK